jgi:hypothetical protein
MNLATNSVLGGVSGVSRRLHAVSVSGRATGPRGRISLVGFWLVSQDRS